MTVIEHCREHLDRLYDLLNLLTDLGYDSTGETAYEDTKALETELLRLTDLHRGAVDAALRDVLEEAKRRTPQLTGDRLAMTIGYVVIDRLRGQ
jgi:hypothetical protein